MIRAAALLVLAAACVPEAGRPDRDVDLYPSVLAAEDARPADGRPLEVLVAATALPDPALRRTAVRALGRLEDPVLAPEISRLLDDPDPRVRGAAAQALAQSVHGRDGSDVLDALLSRVVVEEDPYVRGVLARSLGRLGLGSRERRLALQALVDLSRLGGDDPPTETLLGVVLGIEATVRGSGEEGLAPSPAERLSELLSHGREGMRVDAARVRAVALSTLGRVRRLGLDQIRQAMADTDAEVRRGAVTHLDAVAPEARMGLIRQALTDPSPLVAIEAVHFLDDGPRNEAYCALLVAAAQPGITASVRVEALRALRRPCPPIAEQRTTLITAASELDDASHAGWHAAAQALESLPRIDLDAAGRLLPRFASHPSSFVRAHAAVTAGSLRDGQTLRTLATDPSANVRTAALRELFGLDGHAIDDLLIEQLSDDDPYLLITAADLLEGSPAGSLAASTALGAFERISTAMRETWRDPRRALLERVAELGEASMAGRLRPYLHDYDAAVAGDVAEILSEWTDETGEVTPEPLPRAPVPGSAEHAELVGTTVTLVMRDGGSIVIEVLPDVAVLNVRRFVRLAAEGFYDGLTFHRWAPNFVLQGGSPGANEYQGDGPYTRDEVGDASHWRGTVGVSTRGRDTGDGQIFINLVHNVRLDHQYTVIGRVVEGLDVVDALLEGAVIERAVVGSDP